VTSRNTKKISVCGGSGAADCAKASPVYVNKSWLVSELQGVLDFRDKFQVPVWIDQWGVHSDSGSGNPDFKEQQEQYLSDILDVFEWNGLLWTDWIWRRPLPWKCGSGYSVICQEVNGTYSINQLALNSLKKYLA